MKKKECIFILGMHRSGTSALTGIFDLLGANIGENVMSPAYDNPKGFFENSKIIDLNNEILATLNINWLTAFVPKYDNLSTKEIIEFKQNIKSIIQEEFSEHELFAIKDPRLCLVLPLWQSVLEGLGITVKYVLIKRNPIEISRSLEKRNGIPSFQSFMLWINYLLQAEMLTRNKDRIFVSYENLIKNPIKVIQEISNQLNIFSVTEIENKTPLINDFIVSDLRHHKVSVEKIKDLNLPSYYDEFYHLTKNLSQKNEDFINIKLRIDKIRKNHYQNLLPFETIIEKTIPQSQVYIDRGKGFNETDAIRKLIYSIGKKKMEFDLSSFKDIKAIRIDPLDCPCIIKISKIELILENGTIHNCSNLYTNAYTEKEEELYFDTFDSQILIDLLPFKGSSFVKLVFEVDYIFLNAEALIIMNNQSKQIIKKMSALVFDIEKIDNKSIVDDDLSIENIEYNFVNDINQNVSQSGEKSVLDSLEKKETHEEKKESFEIAAQLFYDLGTGFNEGDSITYNIASNVKQIVFDVSEKVTQPLEKLRFDPSNTPILVKVEKIYAISQDGIQESLEILEYNGIFLPKSGKYIFISHDPIFIFSKPSFIPRKISLELEYNQIGQDAINELGHLFQNFEVIKKTDLKAIQSKHHQETLYQHQLAAIEEEQSTFLGQKDEKIQDLTHLLEKSENKIRENEFQLEELNKNLNNYSLLLEQKNTYISASESNALIQQKLLEDHLKTIRSLEVLLTTNQTLFDENEKQREQLHLKLQKLKSHIEQKDSLLKSQSIEYDNLISIRSELEIKNHELTNLLKMEKTSRERTEQKINALHKERQTLHGEVKENQVRLDNLLNRIEAINKNIGLQKHSIEKLAEIIHQKDQVIALQNEELLLKEQENKNASFSNRLWRLITWPFRFIYGVFTNPKGPIALIFAFFTASLFRPIALIKNINRKNINTLFKALKKESPSQIFQNFKRLLNSSPSKNSTHKPSNVVSLPPQISEVQNIAVAEPIGISSPEAEPIDVLEEATAGEMLMYIDFAKYKGKDLIKILGWGISKQGIKKVEIWSNDLKIGEAQCGVERLDVHAAFSDYPGSDRSGFDYEARTKQVLTKIKIRVIGQDNKFIQLPMEVPPCDVPEILQKEKKNPYDVWIKNNTVTKKLRKQLIIQQKQFAYRPLISIVIPVYNVEEKWLEKAINSIKGQIYDHWEICMADDASPKKHVAAYLKQAEQSDSRIKVFYRKKNGRISAATNSALRIASGDFIAFMDNDDELSENALYEIVAALNKDKTIDILYSDEDKLTEEGKRYEPFFKPEWSPELLLSYNYFNHLLCVRKSICDKVKGLRSTFDGAQDYDFILRCIDKSKNVHHIPKVLYHWRALEGSIAAAGNAKSESFHFFDKCTGALQAHLDRNQIAAKAYRPPFAEEHGLGLNHLKWPITGPLVSIIIPSKNHYSTLKKCIDSLKKTSYKRYEVIIADNASDDKQTLRYLSKLKRQSNFKVLTIPNPGNRFSYSYINNQAVKKAKGEYILFLNDDIEVINADWMSQMVGYVGLEGVGMVGAKLLYPDDTVQHAGVLNGLYPHGYDNLPDHSFKHVSKEALGYFFFNQVARNYSSVTAACLLMSKKLFTGLGGFDEENFALAYNDVDLCLRVIKEGQRVVFAPNALLYHYESKSRKNVLYIEEVASFKKKWRDYEEPFYSPNLSKVEPFHVAPFSTLDYKAAEEKILIATHNLNFEGAPIQMLEIVEGFLVKNPNLNIEIYSPQDGPLKESYEALGLPIYIFEDPVTEALKGIKPYEEGIVNFSNWMKKGDYTSVYANTLITFFVHEACHAIGVKSIWGIHESSPPQEFFTYLPVKLQAKAYNSFSYPYALVFVAKATQRIFHDFDVNHSSIVINNGLRTQRFQYLGQKVIRQKEIKKQLGIKPDDVLYLNLGTVCERKGQLDFVIAAVERIKKGMTNARFLLVGVRDRGVTGAYLAKIRTIIEDNKLQEYFIIIDETSDVEQYYLAADIFVCSSYNESYPRVLLEAMLFQLPIITTPIFGIVEQVIENINALFYQPGDNELLGEHIFELATNEEKRKAFEKNAPYVYGLINSYEEMVDKYEAIM